jgi:hypothetical protein
MIEHVGVANLPEYLRTAWRLLRPGGAFLFHGIGQSPASKARRGPFFADRYVFPDSELPLFGELLREAEDCGFEIREVESLRDHFVLTLRCSEGTSRSAPRARAAHGGRERIRALAPVHRGRRVSLPDRRLEPKTRHCSSSRMTARRIVAFLEARNRRKHGCTGGRTPTIRHPSDRLRADTGRHAAASTPRPGTPLAIDRDKARLPRADD